MVTGDTFNAGYDKIIHNLPHKTKCVDYVTGWASTLGKLFSDTVTFLTVTGQHGVIWNPDKFIWGRRELESEGGRGQAHQRDHAGHLPVPQADRHHWDLVLVWVSGAGCF